MAPWQHGFTFVFTLVTVRATWSQAHGNIKKISPETMQRIGNGYLFLDWFAIPQLPGRDQWRMGIKFFGAPQAMHSWGPYGLTASKNWGEWELWVYSNHNQLLFALRQMVEPPLKLVSTTLRPNLWTHFQESCGIFGSMVQLPKISVDSIGSPLISHLPGSQHESMAWTKRTLVPMQQGPCRASLRMWRRGLTLENLGDGWMACLFWRCMGKCTKQIKIGIIGLWMGTYSRTAITC